MGSSVTDTGVGIAPPPGAVILGNVNYIPPGLEPYYKSPFSYNVVFINILAGAVVTATTQINNDSYFVCTQATADIFDNATGRTNISPAVFPGLVRILDSSSGKFQMDQPTPVSGLFGTALQPFVWLYRSNIWMPGGQISVELTNNNNIAQNVRFTFTGFKVFGQLDQLVNT